MYALIQNVLRLTIIQKALFVTKYFVKKIVIAIQATVLLNTFPALTILVKVVITIFKVIIVMISNA
jgi:hypothetical protein